MAAARRSTQPKGESAITAGSAGWKLPSGSGPRNGRKHRSTCETVIQPEQEGERTTKEAPPVQCVVAKGHWQDCQHAPAVETPRRLSPPRPHPRDPAPARLSMSSLRPWYAAPGMASAGPCPWSSARQRGSSSVCVAPHRGRGVLPRPCRRSCYRSSPWSVPAATLGWAGRRRHSSQAAAPVPSA